jgi:peptide deformylase
LIEAWIDDGGTIQVRQKENNHAMYDIDELVKLGILQFPDKSLKVESCPVESFGGETLDLAEHMIETCRLAPGSGLAAIQIGIEKRIFVADPSRDPHETEFIAFVNPVIKPLTREEITFDEGCLSIPNVYLPVRRPSEIEIEYFTPRGIRKTMRFKQFAAVVLQHEYDHLNGTLILDRVSRLRREGALRKIKKAEINRRKR